MKADLHCHSMYSKHPSDWFLQRIGAAESYTTLETIHRRMKQRGMNFFALTDHNTMEGSLRLCKKYPETVISGVESTAYFPEDQCKIHILIYGIDSDEFATIQNLRTNIYLLQDYLYRMGIAHAVAHATFSVNKKLTPWHVERLLLLFNTFETQNGSCTKDTNRGLSDLLADLTPQHIETLISKHSLSPQGNTPWEKICIGGSDDHSGLYLGETYTEVEYADSKDGFLEKIRRGQCVPGGRNSDFRSLTFHFYKTAIDFSSQNNTNRTHTFLSHFSSYISEGKTLGLRGKLNLKKIKNTALRNHMAKLFDKKRNASASLEERKTLLYEFLANITDDLLIEIFSSLQSKIKTGDFMGVMRSISSLIPPLFFSAPFFSSMEHHYKDKQILSDLEKNLGMEQKKKKHILWFTDTIFELNGPAESLRKIVRTAHHMEDIDITLIVTADKADKTDDLPPNTLVLPAVYSAKLPQYENISIRIPSLLRTIEKIDTLRADEIVISTPGPLGLLGRMLGRVSAIPVHAVFHTDFSRQADSITKSPALAGAVESYVRWFYSACDTILIPSRTYMRILSERNYPKERFALFHRGIDTKTFSYDSTRRNILDSRYTTEGKFILLYTGRISRDKNIDFLLETYKQAVVKHSKVALFVIGDGPDLSECRKKMSSYESVFFTGRLERKELADFYSAADMFLFPSTTDTFGMSVLEALCSGLPVLCSPEGGPADLVKGVDLCAALELNHGLWVSKICETALLYTSEEYQNYRRGISAKISRERNWEEVIRTYPFAAHDEEEPRIEHILEPSY
jgi:glycosyltransferase involved in cell wall biosynthesis